jgi:ATP-dependent DNA ligase
MMFIPASQPSHVLDALRRNSGCLQIGITGGIGRNTHTVGGTTFDALIFGYYEEKTLMYAARTRNGFTPALRAELMKRLRPLQMSDCPFANLPEKRKGRWGQGLTAEKMKECRWVKPGLVGQFEFLEWTSENHLRHSRFVALREDKKAHEVVRET